MMHPDKKYIFITNILPPYRIFIFNELAAIGKVRNFAFEVIVMGKTEVGRFWQLDTRKLNFKNWVDEKGIYFYLFGRFHFHFNPGIIKYIINCGKCNVVLGGSWNDINVLTITILKRLGLISCYISFWSEANYLSEATKSTCLKGNFKRFVLGTCDKYFIIPGDLARITLFEKWHIKKKNVIYLPNLIDNKFFKIDRSAPNARLSSSVKIVLIVARLIENTKGILNFLNSIDYTSNFMIRVAGDGSDRELMQAYLIKNKLGDRVILLGNLTEQQLRFEYSNANLFVLPSFTDPSPLSIVEASFMSLPLFISENCGNKSELLEEGRNGLSFNPLNLIQIRSKFASMIGLSNVELQEMGNISLEIANRNFNPQIVLNSLISNFE